jgi:hypothetical protein
MSFDPRALNDASSIAVRPAGSCLRLRPTLREAGQAAGVEVELPTGRIRPHPDHRRPSRTGRLPGGPPRCPGRLGEQLRAAGVAGAAMLAGGVTLLRTTARPGSGAGRSTPAMTLRPSVDSVAFRPAGKRVGGHPRIRVSWKMAVTAGMARRWRLPALTWGPRPAMVDGVVGRTKRVAVPQALHRWPPGHDPTGRPPRSRGRTGCGGLPPPPRPVRPSRASGPVRHTRRHGHMVPLSVVAGRAGEPCLRPTNPGSAGCPIPGRWGRPGRPASPPP